MEKTIDSKYIFSIRIWLLLHRLFGITFGGLVVDTNGRLAINKVFRFYGKTLATILTIFVLVSYSVVFVVRDLSSSAVDSIIERYPEHFRKFIWYCFGANNLLHDLYKVSIFIYFNFKGFEIIECIVENYENSAKLILMSIGLFIYWAAKIVIFTSIIIYKSFELDSIIMQSFYIMTAIGFIHIAAFSLILSLVSIVFRNRLEIFVKNLKNFKTNSGN